MKAKFESCCLRCGTTIKVGASITEHKYSWIHSNCVPSGDSRADSEYYAGLRDGHNYSQDVKAYGRELADAWEMEAEWARYNQGY
tara:strand:+ start:537 stop:791 length:255 start_codon:yes stop_codon:yes gene_type:complete